MSYPPPDPNQYAIGGQQFWRLNTLLTSDGDIYQSEQGAAGFAIGPDSDISKVNIAYFDDQVSGFQNQVAISPQRPFPGTLYSRNDATFVPSNRPGRFLIWPDELFNPDAIPFATALRRVDVITPVLDVVQYFNPVGLTPGRNDKEYQFQFLPFSDDIVFYYVIIPFYGRKFASITVKNGRPAGRPNLVVTAFGVTYAMSSELSSAAATAISSVSITVSPGVSDTAVIQASVDGMFDAIVLSFTGGGALDQPDNNCLARIRVSDTER